MTAAWERVEQAGFDYMLKRSRRRTLAIHVRPGPVVEVRAPQRLSRAVIERFIAERADWIDAKLAELEALPAPFRPAYRDGERHPFLGTDYPLIVTGGSRGVSLRAGRLEVGVPDADDRDAVQRALYRWYRARAGEVFRERLDAALQALASWQLPQPRLAIRAMRRRWGSCSSTGKVTLNLHLIKMPVALLDYVVCHELCHLLEMNHSPRFYALMDAAMPDWRGHRHNLRAYGSLYLG
ncbi:M48 family metallopeptidase [Ectothiorhodospiraceae bacterium WFHF3C12]|nr:M48 family metallopeptidase [Ectothiorhodospiraceae bacterium WFHF3C12]